MGATFFLGAEKARYRTQKHIGPCTSLKFDLKQLSLACRFRKSEEVKRTKPEIRSPKNVPVTKQIKPAESDLQDAFHLPSVPSVRAIQ